MAKQIVVDISDEMLDQADEMFVRINNTIAKHLPKNDNKKYCGLVHGLAAFAFATSISTRVRGEDRSPKLSRRDLMRIAAAALERVDELLEQELTKQIASN